MEKLIEQVSDWRTPQLRLDRDQRMVWNIALAGTVSRNGYRYSESALREAVELYEGKPVFLDHSTAAGRPQDRSARDLVGTIHNARFEEGRVRGDVRVLETEAGETFWALVEAPSMAVGMSHVVLVERGTDAGLVERIRDVVSVDAVVFPATVTFQEQMEAQEQIESPAGNQEPASVVAGTTSVDVGFTEEDFSDATFSCASTENITLLRERLTVLETELEQYRRDEARAVRRREMERLLEQERVPGEAISAGFCELLLRVEDQSLRGELVRERVRAWREWSRPGPMSCVRSEGQSRDDDARIVRILSPRRERVLAGI